jgi:hypothetical protein
MKAKADKATGGNIFHFATEEDVQQVIAYLNDDTTFPLHVMSATDHAVLARRKRSWRQRCSNFAVRDGELVFKQLDRVTGQQIFRLVAAQNETERITAILARAHDDQVGHGDRDKTFAKVSGGTSLNSLLMLCVC